MSIAVPVRRRAHHLARRAAVLVGLVFGAAPLGAAILQKAPAERRPPESACMVLNGAATFGYPDATELIKRNIQAQLEEAYLPAEANSRVRRRSYEVARRVRACHGARGLLYLSVALTSPGARWQDLPASTELLMEAARTYLPARTLLGISRITGRKGMKKDVPAGLRLLKEAASREASAMVWLGALYEAGQIEGKGPEDAYGLFFRAAKRGYAPGGTGMARLLLTNQDAGDDDEAWYHLEWAAAQGDPEAKYLLARQLATDRADAARARGYELMNEAADECYQPAITALAGPDRPGRNCLSPFWKWIMR